MWSFWKFYDSIYLHATLVWTFAMLLTGVKNWLFFNSVDILFWEIFQFCAQLCSHAACSLRIILQVALQKQSFFYVIFNSQNNIASMRRYLELQSALWDFCFGLPVTSAMCFKIWVDSLTCMLRWLHAKDSSPGFFVRSHHYFTIYKYHDQLKTITSYVRSLP